jgi:hypothetical protein
MGASSPCCWPTELEVLAFYRQQGRKFGLDAHIDSAAELKRAVIPVAETFCAT